MAQIKPLLEVFCCPTHRLQLTLFEDPGEDEASQRHRHDEDEGERQGGHARLHYPQSHNARQLDDGEHVHTPCLHLKQHTWWLMGRKPKYHRPQNRHTGTHIKTHSQTFSLHKINPTCFWLHLVINTVSFVLCVKYATQSFFFKA